MPPSRLYLLGLGEGNMELLLLEGLFGTGLLGPRLYASSFLGSSSPDNSSEHSTILVSFSITMVDFYLAYFSSD